MVNTHSIATSTPPVTPPVTSSIAALSADQHMWRTIVKQMIDKCDIMFGRIDGSGEHMGLMTTHTMEFQLNLRQTPAANFSVDSHTFSLVVVGTQLIFTIYTIVF